MPRLTGGAFFCHVSLFVAHAAAQGTICRSTDRDALDDVWSFVADAWFEGGQHDPDVRLLKFTPVTGELSVTPISGIKFLYEMAKANLTDDKPDTGQQGAITF